MRNTILPTAFALCALLQAQQMTWVYNPANGHSYGLGPSTTSWSAGEALAASLGGHLATIRNASEQAWIASAFASSLGTNGIWIGLNDLAVEGQWVWSSGEPVTYANWAPGEPNNGSTVEEDAAHLLGTNSGALQWKWNDETEWFSGLLRPLIEVAGLPASYASFGNGCPGPTGPTPTLAGVSGEEPRLGSTARIRVAGLPNTVTVPIFVLGLSNTQDPGPPAYPLPQDLGVLGWQGCSQLVSDDAIDFAITTTGQADYALAVPMTVGLVGFTFHAQALVLYSPSGVAVSNGVTGVVGF